RSARPAARPCPSARNLPRRRSRAARSRRAAARSCGLLRLRGPLRRLELVQLHLHEVAVERIGARPAQRAEIRGPGGIEVAERVVDVARDLAERAGELAGVLHVEQRERLLVLLAIAQ